MKNLLKLGAALNKTEQKSINGGFTLIEYIEHCGSGTEGFACFTGLPHCPTGRCGGSVCIPDTNG
ncbi:hypothetical protein D7030_03000 [Flavobacteriaceae bacterium AU392]|nr:hypothetical protein D1817_09475 [Flavobacteriaceae bacterium]RKM85653.1 hypothetical protein D7030_03000 [Flavobacteriaceae bacterium AU392]